MSKRAKQAQETSRFLRLVSVLDSYWTTEPTDKAPSPRCMA